MRAKNFNLSDPHQSHHYIDLGNNLSSELVHSKRTNSIQLTLLLQSIKQRFSIEEFSDDIS